MLNLSELGQRILAELEEFREENIFAMLNTVLDPAGMSQEINDLEHALFELAATGLVVMGYERRAFNDHLRLDKSLSLELISSMAAWFRFDASRSCWTIRTGDLRRTDLPMIFLTETGLLEANSILDEKGYQWWRPRSS